MPEEGESNLKVLLNNLSPQTAGDWAFVVVQDPAELGEIAPLMTFREEEGLTAVVPASASSGLDVRFVGTRIDLTIHSSLSAAGLTAAVSGALAKQNIPANVVAAVYHDYLFVPPDRAEEALSILRSLES